MTCRHDGNDPSCSSYSGNSYGNPPAPSRRYSPSYDSRDNDYSYTAPVSYPSPVVTTPDSKNFTWEAVKQVGSNLVGKIKYPNCSNCAYEGTKVMIFANADIETALLWKEIDPHFASPSVARSKTQAPAPIARFPASKEGWEMALNVATFISLPKKY